MCTPVTAAILELSRLAVLLIYLSQASCCDVQILLHVHFGDKRAILENWLRQILLWYWHVHSDDIGICTLAKRGLILRHVALTSPVAGSLNIFASLWATIA